MPRSLARIIAGAALMVGAALVAVETFCRLILRRPRRDPGDWEGRLF
jgi:hypothetical protein